METDLNNCKIYIWKEDFSIIKSKRVYPHAFANVVDKNEITVVVEESKYDESDIIEISRGWKILTFDMILPFELIGFLAKISSALAEENISIFVVSAYSTDHILVRKKDLLKAIKKLKSLGCIVK